MPTAIRFAEFALVDLEAIQTWNAQESVPEVGARLVSKIPAQIEHLADHPNLGRMVSEFGRL